MSNKQKLMWLAGGIVAGYVFSRPVDRILSKVPVIGSIRA